MVGSNPGIQGSELLGVGELGGGPVTPDAVNGGARLSWLAK